MPTSESEKYSPENLSDLAIPIPIQIYLWKQVSPFIKQRLGKFHEASCSICQQGSTTTIHHAYEKVLVQNLQSGLKADLAEVIRSLPRWRLIQASLPHVMHSVASLLHGRIKDGNIQGLGSVETTLMYTLHWIILDAAEECADSDYENGIYHPSPFYYLFSIPTLTLFVYLFAPICHNFKESDFQNFRLENGMKIWQPMWEFRHPEGLCFSSQCKPKPKNFSNKYWRYKVHFGDVFQGRKHSPEDVPHDSPSHGIGTTSSESQNTSLGATPTTVTVTATITKISDDEVAWVSSPKDTVFPETIPEESSSTEEEHVVIFRLPPLHEADGFLRDPSIYTAETSLFQLAMKRNKKQEHTSIIQEKDQKPSPQTSSSIPDKTDKVSADSKQPSLDGAMGESQDSQKNIPGLNYGDLSGATFLDVAVLRCLFITLWQEEGIYWALHYMYNRLRDISEASSGQQQPRRRSNSLPIPKIEVSLYQSTESKKSDGNKDFIEVPEVKDVSLLAESPYVCQKQRSEESIHRRASEKIKKKMKMADLRAFVETKLLSKSEKALEKIGQDEPKTLAEQMEYHRSLDTGDEHLTRPNSSTRSTFQPSNLVKGKSMPSLRYIGEIHCDRRKASKYGSHTQPMANPIITVTEHTPIPSPDYLRRQGSMDSQLDAASLSGSKSGHWQDRKSSLTRSQTDSNITYAGEDVPEAPGSACYITKDGDIDLDVVLKAVHATAMRDTKFCTLRVLEVILNLVELLMDMGVLKQFLRDEALGNNISVSVTEASPRKPAKESCTKNTSGIEGEKSPKPMTSHRLIMNTIIRILKHLGCPHGCSDGQRGPAAEFLRTQCQNVLTKLNRASGKEFKGFLRDFIKSHYLPDILEFFHAYVGFCIDPSSLLSPLSVGGSGIRGVEGDLVSHTFKPLVTRFVEIAKEVKMPENLSLHCEIRQLMIYVKEGHGSVFRRVALSALLDTADRPNKKRNKNVQTTRVIRHMHHSEMEEPPEPVSETINYGSEEKSSRKLLFKKRSTSSTCANLLIQSLLETEAEETFKSSQSPIGNLRKKHHILTPRQSERTLGIAESTVTKPKPISKIVNWFKRSGHDSTDSVDNIDNIENFTDSMSYIKSTKFAEKSSTKSNVGQTLQKAKRRVEDKFSKFVLKKGKKKDRSMEESSGTYMSRRNSYEMGESSRESEFVVLKERKLISTTEVLSGTLRFSFLLETCPPGSVPDAHLLASLIDLPHSAVVARAAILMECAYFVHCCNKGQWPSWMKLNYPIFRQSGPLPTRGPTTGIRRSHVLQRSAGKMFHQWAEMLGQRLEEMINEDKANETHIATMVSDEQKQKELLTQDEEEDYLDEETYQTIPKSSRAAGKEKSTPWERLYSREANRRWSMALSSMGHSQTSAQSLQSIAGDRDSGQTERKISFVLHEPDNESEGSSNTTVTVQGEDGKKMGQPARPFLLRRGTAQPSGGSFKRRSLKLRRGTREGKEIEAECRIPETVKRTDSIQSKRKVSSLSDRSDTSEPGIAGEASGEESPGVLSDDQPPESPTDSNDTDDTNKHMPWLKTMVQVTNSLYYFCPHQNFCHPFCYRRVMRSCSRLVKAVRKVYGEEFGVFEDKLGMDFEGKKKNKKDKGQNRKISDQTSSQVSPIRRKDSVGKRDKIDKNLDGSQFGKLSSKDSSKDLPDSTSGSGAAATADSAKDGGGSANEPLPILKYIKTHVKDVFHAPLATLMKGAVILSEEHFAGIIPVAWELLLESNQEVAASAASLFILGAVKAPHQVSEVMQHSLSHSDIQIRINAILRFQVLWKMRYQVWPRMEEGAHALFKVPPPGIEFTLPSPKIGIESLDVVDSPWELLVKTKVEEVTINQERHRSLVTATKTRKKQQTELIKMALQAQDDKKREERENFLITTIPITIQAAHEPSLYHTGEDHEEDDEQIDGQPRNTGHHLHSAHSLFPSCLCSAVVQIINLLDDGAVSADGNAVYEVAYQVIWCCLVEDSALFLRYILERLTREKQERMFKILRHLIRFIPKLPQQAAFALYNYIIGYVMFYVRSTHEEGQHLIGAALSLLWMVVHSVHGIMFKDLKQILRKEQCDASILLTANVPSAKKIIVHGPQDPDAGGIPSQFPVQEDTQFCQILREALDFFGIDENRHKEFFLVDYKTHQIKNPNSYVRDFYFFKRSQYPQLELVHMKEEDAFNALQKQELVQKFIEIGKVLLTWAILKNVDMVVQRVVFLHEELMKLPSFPRKALESNLDLYKGGELGKVLLGLDVLHKFMWIRLIARMFEAMAGNFAYSGDIHLFLNVLNGSLILHSEDAGILRYVMATYINAAFHFKNIFSTNGYLLIMPTLLKIYSNHQTNKLVTTTIEYAVKQFYLMNRKPFILQMFGSVSAMLDTEEEGTYGDAHKIQSSCLFNLLLSLETPSPDPLNIAELVKEDKPLKAIDFCYHDENEMVTILDCISLCVMVVSYSSESVRGYQMLIILEAILPCYVQHIQLPSYNKEGKTEKEIINQLAVAIKTLVNNSESLTKSYNGPYRSSPEHKGSSQRNYSRGPYSTGFDFEDESHSKFMSEHSRAKSMYEHDVEDSEVLRAEYRRPRDVLLSLVGEFMCRASNRLQELNKKNNQEGKVIELLDIKSHIRLADIAHTLLKVSPYDPESMGCRGLQHYMSYILPSTEWANDAMRPALVTILRRLDKVFQKISKKPSIRRNTDWDAAAGLLKGIYDTMNKYPYIIHWQHIKGLLNTCQSLIVTDNCSGEGVSSATAALMSRTPPPQFCSVVVRLIALQIQSNTEQSNALEQVCGGSSVHPTQEKAESAIINLIMPLCLRVGTGILRMGRERKYLRKKRSKSSRYHEIAANKQHCDKFIRNILFDLCSSAMDIVETREREFVYNEHVVIENGEAALDKESYEEVERDITSTGSLSEDIYIGKNKDDEYDFTWGSLKSYEEISQEKLVIENIIEPSRISGYRIVDIDYFLKNSITLQYNHSKKCTGGRLDFHEEKRKGLTSSFIFKCNVCNKQEILYSENPKKEAVNKAAVWGTLSTGSTYSHMKEFLSILDIPTMSQNMFFDSQRTLGYVWKESLWENMQLAGKEEYEIAKANGRIDSDGVPYITVLLDGGWSKRSYGHSYNASSGVAVIIGRATGKLIYLGIRNKFCIVCTKAENKGKTVSDHVCFKNWTGTSSAMEPDIIVEGFNSSISMYGLRYKCFIADGDSTVYAHIKKRVSYGQEVTKIECTNHCIKNYSKHLYRISKDTTNVALSARKILKSNVIKELAKMVQRAIYANALGDIRILKEDIRNTVPHVFGCHSNCKAYMCDNSSEDPEKYKEFLNSGAHHHIYGALNLIISKGHLLIDNETNNRAELFMSILAKFNMGKRLNLIQRDSFSTRAMLTGLSYNQGALWHQTSWKKYFGRSPGKNLKLYMGRKERSKRAHIEVSRSKPKVSRKLNFTKNNNDYGPNIAEIELSATDLETEVENLIGRLQVTREQYNNIPNETIGQFNNPRYCTERMNRLTASNFGKVIKRRPTTSCDVLVRQILDINGIHSASIEYGKKNEIVAISKFEEKTGKKVVPIGLFVHPILGYLGATPDGIISETEIIEVKCLFKVAKSKITLEEAVRQKQVACMESDKEGNLKLKKSHDYYYQIQGQLAISQRIICYFVVYTGDSNDIFIEMINFDYSFWEEIMMPKLRTFYMECLAPEIILNRRRKKLKCRDPDSIIHAQLKKMKTKNAENSQ